MFKNLTAFHLPKGWPFSLDAMEKAAKEHLSKPCGAMDRKVSGWTEINGGLGLIFGQNGQFLLRVRVEEKVLPGGVIKKRFREALAKVEDQLGYKLGAKKKKELRESIENELLPKAFVKDSFLFVWIDTKGKWICVDTGSTTKAGEVIELVRRTFDPSPDIHSFTTKVAPSSLMGQWIEESEPPAGFTIDDECELTLPDEAKATVKFVHHPLEGEDVRQHIAEGKQAKRLGMTFENKLSFIITDKLEFKKLNLVEGIDGKEDDDDAAKIVGEFLAITESGSSLLTTFAEIFGGVIQGAADNNGFPE